MAVEFRLLGAFEARIDGRAFDVGHARQQCVLVTLLIEANRTVPVDRLIDRVWADRPPQRARGALYNYLSRLRRALAPAVDVQIARQSTGYVLAVDPRAVDVHRFRDLIAHARATTIDEDAEAMFEQALGLWRGDAFATLDTPWLNTVRGGLDTERLAAELDRTDVALRRGQHAALLAELTARVAAHPLDERAGGQLMQALYRCGRQGDALGLYQQIRRRLADELGADPSHPLRELHQQILTADTALTVRGTDGRSVPAQLPADVYAFTGRSAELSHLNRLLNRRTGAPTTAAREDEPATALLISAVSGTAGVGKTSLAVRWAHSVRESFPDGQLYLNLRGYDPEQPVSAGDALARFLTALGVPNPDIPLEVDDRAARYRTELAGRRILVVLDNASSVEQVRLLLPGTPTCLVLVTSRDSLAGLVAIHGADRLDLDLLPASDAVTLLHRLIGDRVDAEPQAAAMLAVQCARLPLALRVAAELAVARPANSLADLVTELSDQQQRLDLFDGGEDARAAVRSVFSWSYRHLPDYAARAFRLLGLHPGADLDPYAAAALTGSGLNQARRTLDLLARANLVQPVGVGRYGMHDLLRAYATELATVDGTEADRRTAMTGLYDHYLNTTAAAMDSLHPAQQHRRPPILTSASPNPPVTEPAAARRWLETELPNLVAVCTHTADHGRSDHTVDLATTVFPYLETGGHYPEALAIHTHALRAARDKGDRAAEADALTHLGRVYWWQGNYRRAADHHQEALDLYQQIGQPANEGQALHGLGLVSWRHGEFGRAAEQFRQALFQFRQVGERDGEAWALQGLGLVYWRKGQLAVATDYVEQALTLFKRVGDRFGEALALFSLGLGHVRKGQLGMATDFFHQTLGVFQELGERVVEAYALYGLGTVHQRLGELDVAEDHFRRALDVFQQVGGGGGEAEALNALGETRQAAGATQEARTWHADALALAIEFGDRYEQARAHDGIAVTYRTSGDLDHARLHWSQAVALYTDIDVPDADAIRAQLTALD